MDEIDRVILEELKKNSRISFVELGKKLNMSESAVRRRVKNLQKAGVIRRFTIEVGDGAISAFVLVSVEPSIPTGEVAEEIARIPNVRSIHEVTGVYDIVVTISAVSVAETNRCIDEIRRVRGVKSTNTMIVLREIP
ncbi:MAG: Lrp/AsnC family transcriptional regulator [Thermoproteota archaeon]|jgi:DNA-binding Lrp family transcriptional regulator|uniref:Lrp/AsnC family transcriptional regulator n=1 Tax=Candidatus Methanodesulfokora washburnensis TaxID=2478471 RepID=A0A3R9PT17_9CREN|nr:Lrp/AsnC family transcriptional regulator [Candidatus Methanodesulfokores washburnensis]TDA37477.1 MAG: Lrp/AsnC family transcriptional regulator [Candidatus Korarchaeota archaeon]RSN72318.1 Lrp/AsnC family transcriptional regulator [Candidatus Methanodesulfokores washburnensis]RZN59954.1 MAG: Lrp/AsnC family transcriptional regulator [Candidatus Methanodesulfokores washburnensis]RZN63082.1 MAG: Lrp/AsnC family transcriptional regulator [Candidatus Methanodesulfokores washburnensis]TDA37791